MMRRLMLSVALVVGFVCVVHAAELTCGAVLDRGKHVLTEDLVCEDFEVPAVTLTNGARLDLGGYTIHGMQIVVLLEGRGGMVQNGAIFVRFGDHGVVTLAGHGGHTMQRLEIVGDMGPGVHVQSDGNRVSEVRASSDGFGIIVDGRSNMLSANVARGQVAFWVGGESNRLLRNVAAFGHLGFIVAGDRNALIGNEAMMMTEHGILVTGVGNHILRNTAFENAIDLADANGDCTQNLWRANIFNTAEPACIAGPGKVGGGEG